MTLLSTSGGWARNPTPFPKLCRSLPGSSQITGPPRYQPCQLAMAPTSSRGGLFLAYRGTSLIRNMPRRALPARIDRGTPGALLAGFPPEDKGPYALTPNTIKLIPTLGALFLRSGPVQDPVHTSTRSS